MKYLALLIALMSAPCLGQTLSPAIDVDDLPGIWEGTLGKQEIRVCFTAANDPTLNYVGGQGRYYYRRHLKPISLYRPGDELQWEERSESVVGGDPTGIWSLVSLGKNEMSVKWNKPGEIKFLPIELKRISASGSVQEKGVNSDPSCDHPAFWEPLMHTAKTEILIGEPQNVDGLLYRAVTFRLSSNQSPRDIKTFELVDKKYSAFNRILSSEFKNDVAELRQCNARSGGGGSRENVPVSKASHFLTVRLSWDDGCCGCFKGGFGLVTYDVTSGKYESFSDWFLGRPNDYYEGSQNASAMAALREIIIKQCKAENEASPETCENQEISKIYPTMKVLMFELGDTSMDGISVGVPYNRLIPFLSEKGKAEVSAIMRD